MKGYVFAYQLYIEKETEFGVETVLANLYKKGAIKKIVPITEEPIIDQITIEDQLSGEVIEEIIDELTNEDELVSE